MVKTLKPQTPAFVVDPKKTEEFLAFKGNSARKHVEEIIAKRPQLGVDRFVRH